MQGLTPQPKTKILKPHIPMSNNVNNDYVNKTLNSLSHNPLLNRKSVHNAFEYAQEES